MIRGKENIIKWVSSAPKVSQVQVRVSPGTDAFLFQTEEGENPKAIVSRLRDTLEIIEPGKYYIEMSDGNAKRNWYRDYIVIEGDTETAPVVGGFSGLSPDEVDRRIQDALARQQQEFELAELRAKVKEYEKELEEPGPIETAIGAVAPYIPALMEKIFGRGTQVGIAGIEQSTADPMPVRGDGEDSARLMAIGERLASIEPEYLSLLEKLCDKLENNPSLLNVIKSFA